jgi:hypothetical protein
MSPFRQKDRKTERQFAIMKKNRKKQTDRQRHKGAQDGGGQWVVEHHIPGG